MQTIKTFVGHYLGSSYFCFFMSEYISNGRSAQGPIVPRDFKSYRLSVPAAGHQMHRGLFRASTVSAKGRDNYIRAMLCQYWGHGFRNLQLRNPLNKAKCVCRIYQTGFMPFDATKPVKHTLQKVYYLCIQSI